MPKNRKEYLKRYRSKNKDKLKKQFKEWRKENKAERKEYMEKWRKENKEHIYQYQKNWDKENKDKRKGYDAMRDKEKIKEIRRKGYQKHRLKRLKDMKKYQKTKRGKEVSKTTQRNRRAKMKNIIHDFSTKEWLSKLAETKGICPECKLFVGVENLTLDHIHPISKAENGQVYTIKDVQPLCRGCNSKKGNKIAVVGSKNGR